MNIYICLFQDNFHKEKHLKLTYSEEQILENVVPCFKLLSLFKLLAALV